MASSWIYLSPHFDDAVLSCGGLIWLQARTRPVEIWTACAGEIPPSPLAPFAESLHTRWGTGLAAIPARTSEDDAACRAVGAAWRRYSLPDCIYRLLPDGSPVINGEDDLWKPPPPGEQHLVQKLSAWLAQNLPAGSHLVAPLGLGGHIDHRLVRSAAERLGVPLWYYADYPYTVRHGFSPQDWLGSPRRMHARPVTPEALHAWQAGIAAYRSQVSTFWSGLEEMRRAIAAYAATPAGHSLWRPMPPDHSEA